MYLENYCVNISIILIIIIVCLYMYSEKSYIIIKVGLVTL